MGLVAIALFNKVTGAGSAGGLSPKLEEFVAKAAEDLKKGNGLVVCGSNDAHIQTIVNGINDKIGANQKP